MLKIWGRANSINMQKVLWLTSELKLNYEHIPAGGSFGGLNTPEFQAMNPHSRIPTIKDKDTIVWESHTILRYLAAQYGKEFLWSQDPGLRAQAEQWMDWAQTSLQPAFIEGVFWGFYRTPELQRDWPAIRRNVERCSQYFQLLEKILGHQKYLAGNDFTLADITVGTMLFRYFELDITRPKIPQVEAWYQRLQTRPGYKEFVMVDFAEFKGKLS